LKDNQEAKRYPEKMCVEAKAKAYKLVNGRRRLKN
jgi:hypothetical protein